MNKNIQSLLDRLHEFENSPQGVGFDLRLDLSDIIVQACMTGGWTHKQIAEKAGMKPSQLSKIVHGSANCTFDVAGRVLFALGLQGKLVTTPMVVRGSTPSPRARNSHPSGTPKPNGEFKPNGTLKPRRSVTIPLPTTKPTPIASSKSRRASA